jgi:hypothetical protein
MLQPCKRPISRSRAPACMHICCANCQTQHSVWHSYWCTRVYLLCVVAGKGSSSGVGFAIPIDTVKGLVDQVGGNHDANCSMLY